jgi:flagellar M-ring protein FliF
MAESAQAQVPVTAGGPGVPSVGTEGLLSPVVEGLGRLSVPRQIGVIVGLAATIALALWVVLWTRDADMRPLYGTLENLDAASVVNVLESNRIPYRLDPATGMLLVEAGRYDDARLKLAEAGMPSDNAVGFEMLDKEQGLGTSQFMETARYRRSLEGELARTIASITSVRSARVHLAIPERTVFVRDRRKPSASVLLDVVPGRVVEPGQVRAIGNLVASSVPELELSSVTIVDQKGRLLSDFAHDAEAEMANKQLEYTRRLEDQVVERVHRILDPIVGSGRYKAEATADVDFTAVEQTDEVYNPDLPAIRSEQRLDEQRVPGEAGAGIPGALSNQPPASGAAPEVATPAAGAEGATPAAPRDVRTQSTRNYELDRSLSYTRHQVGRLRRLTVAVVLDDKLSVAAGAEEGATGTTKAPWDAAELERITRLVRDAVGYDAARGDSVEVLNAAFFDLPVVEEPIPQLPIWEHTLFWPGVRMALGAIGLLLLVFAVVRPVLRGLSSNVKQLRALEERHRMEKMLAEAAAEAQGREDDAMLLPPPNREYERRLSAIQSMVEGDAEKVAQVVRKWVREGD